MKRICLFFLLVLCVGGVKAEPVVAQGLVKVIVAGYEDGSFALVLANAAKEALPAENPASCTSTNAYFFPKNAGGGELIAFDLLNNSNRAAVVVRDDACHPAVGPDIPDGTTFPVIQRVIKLRF